MPKYQIPLSPCSGSRVVPCGRTSNQPGRQAGRHVEANSRFTQFCECV